MEAQSPSCWSGCGLSDRCRKKINDVITGYDSPPQPKTSRACTPQITPYSDRLRSLPARPAETSGPRNRAGVRDISVGQFASSHHLRRCIPDQRVDKNDEYEKQEAREQPGFGGAACRLIRRPHGRDLASGLCDKNLEERKKIVGCEVCAVPVSIQHLSHVRPARNPGIEILRRLGHVAVMDHARGHFSGHLAGFVGESVSRWSHQSFVVG